MGDTYAQWELEQRAADAGRSAEYQRRFERGYEEARARLDAVMRQPVPTSPFVEPEVRQLAAPVPVRATGDRARWLRDTWGGKISRLFTPADEAAELAEAKALADQHELTYGSRPALVHFLHKVRGSGTGTGAVLTGETAEVLGTIRLANPDQPIQMVVGPDPAAAQIGGVTTAPGRGPEPTGDPGFAAAMLQNIAARRP
jgi:hypothetical protein